MSTANAVINEYEIVIIIRPDLDEAAIQEVANKIESVITDNQGQILVKDDWGQRKLAYPIKKHLKGHYFVISFIAPPELITELERRVRITDDIIRFLTVNRADAVDVPTRLRQAAEQRRLREEEAKARAEAEARGGGRDEDDEEFDEEYDD